MFRRCMGCSGLGSIRYANKVYKCTICKGSGIIDDGMDDKIKEERKMLGYKLQPIKNEARY